MPATSVLLLTAGAPRTDDLAVALTGELTGVADRLGAGGTVHLLVREPDPPPTAPTVPRAPSGEFGAALVLDGGPSATIADLIAGSAGIGPRLGAALDPSRSAVLVGVDHVIMAGEGPAVRLYALRRLPHLDTAQFLHYWLDTHSHFGRRALAGAGYRQVHGDVEASGRAAEASGLAISDIDGAVLSATSSWEAYQQRRTVPGATAAGAEALADEDNFIDHSRSMAMAYTRIETRP